MSGKMPATIFAFGVPMPRIIRLPLSVITAFALMAILIGFVALIIVIVSPFAIIGITIAFAILKYIGKRTSPKL